MFGPKMLPATRAQPCYRGDRRGLLRQLSPNSYRCMYVYIYIYREREREIMRERERFVIYRIRATREPEGGFCDRFPLGRRQSEPA